jgi:hypothetical protein
MVPGALQIALYLFIAGLLLVLFNAADIWEAVNPDRSNGGTSDESVTVSQDGVWSSLTSGRLPQILFWGLIGMVMYGGVWFAWNVLTNLRNDMAADEFVHPKTYSRARYWSTVWGHKIIFAISALVLVVYGYVLFKLLMVLADSSYISVNDFSFPGTILKIGVSVVAIALMLHVFALLLRVSVNSWRSVYKDL